MGLLLLIFILPEGCNLRKKHRESRMAENHLQGVINLRHDISFDSNQIAGFYAAFPGLERFEACVYKVYREHQFHHLWYDKQGVIEFGHSLYTKVQNLQEEGVMASFPYLRQVEGIFEPAVADSLTQAQTELMLTNLYFFYAEKVFRGLPEDSVQAIGWLLPRKPFSYAALLDSMSLNPKVLERDDSLLLPQYYKLRDALQRYREIEKAGGWATINTGPGFGSLKPGDTSGLVLQIRSHLVTTGDLAHDNGSNRFDDELSSAIRKYQYRMGKNPQDQITTELIREMNIPVGDRIRTIMLNMERCRWIEPDVARAGELVVVNIPSFNLIVYRNGRPIFGSPVVVGSVMTKTVIFSGMMSSIVFSPYWNIPQSIINKEVKSGMARDPDYLAKHNMEWNNGQVRQKPGRNNSLGKIKFIFPNSNNIYLHDTPARALFERESRAFSHGCIRVGKPRDLAVTILQDDPSWTPAKIDAAMNAGREYAYPLRKKIPVYIGYFTAWVDNQGSIMFFRDIYDHDNRLAAILTTPDSNP